MVRFVTTKESAHIGRCIYCGATKGKLTEEHVSPFGLNGCVTLLEASCLDCNKVTAGVEQHVLRHMWGAARCPRFASLFWTLTWAEEDLDGTTNIFDTRQVVLVSVSSNEAQHILI